MLRRYKGRDGAEEMQEHFVLLKWGVAVPACCRQPAFLRRIEDGHGCPVPLLKVLALVFACETVVHSYADVAA